MDISNDFSLKDAYKDDAVDEEPEQVILFKQSAEKVKPLIN